MATFKVRGTSYCVIYPYRTEQDEKKQQWETYNTELEAMQRKAYIDYLQKNRLKEELLAAAVDYKSKHESKQPAVERASALDAPKASLPGSAQEIADDNLRKTYREFAEKWLPFHARKRRMTPESYDGYKGVLTVHILPYFGDRVVSTITAEDIDRFVDHLSQKPCRGAKSYNKTPGDIPTLASGSVKKAYNVLMASLRTAKTWKYTPEIPVTTAPSEKNKKRKAWPPERVMEVLTGMEDDKLLRLAVHIAFVCSMRAGEMAGINARSVDLRDRSFWITQEIQRVSDEAIGIIPKGEIICVFPKIRKDSTSSLILKGPKTEGSVRKQYLTTPLLLEIKERIECIQKDKEFFGCEYEDHGLLLCKPNGQPFDPNYFEHAFKQWQLQFGIKPEDTIDLQGLRKSGQMHKVRLTQNNYQLVAENGGQSPEVLMSNYNEALDGEKRTLALLVETSFYQKKGAPQTEPMEQPIGIQAPKDVVTAQSVLDAMRTNPNLMNQIMQVMLLQATGATQGK